MSATLRSVAAQQRRRTLEPARQQVRIRRFAEGAAELAAEMRREKDARRARGRDVERLQVARVREILRAQQVTGGWDEGHAPAKYRGIIARPDDGHPVSHPGLAPLLRGRVDAPAQAPFRAGNAGRAAARGGTTAEGRSACTRCPCAGASTRPRRRGARPGWLTGWPSSGRAIVSAILGRSMAFVPPARHLLRAKDLADARYAEPLDVDDLARAAGLSRAHFSREFRRAFGESPHPYLLTRRLERAAALLRTTDRSVADICFSRRAAERRLVHDELQAHVRHVADRVPRRPPAGRRARASSRPASCAPTAARNTARFEKTARRRVLTSPSTVQSTQEDTMIRIANAQLWVHDQDEALEFYTKKLGMEVRADVTAARDGRLPLAHRRPAGPARRRDRADGDPRPAGDGRGDGRAGPRADGARASPAPSSSPPTTARPPTRSSRRAASSSSSRPRSARTGSTPASATRPATPSG